MRGEEMTMDLQKSGVNAIRVMSPKKHEFKVLEYLKEKRR